MTSPEAKPVLLIRADGNQDDAQALADLGIETVIDPYIRIDRAPDAADAQRLLAELALPGSKWLIATSVNAIRCFAELVGADVLRKAGAQADHLGRVADGEIGSRNGKINRPTHGVKLRREGEFCCIFLKIP